MQKAESTPIDEAKERQLEAFRELVKLSQELGMYE